MIKSKFCQVIFSEKTPVSSPCIPNKNCQFPFFRDLTRHPSVAGTPADKMQAEKLQNFWREEAKLDVTKIIPYDVVLSYPNIENPNKVEVLEDSKPVFQSQEQEAVLHEDQDQEGILPPFNAFSPAGTVQVLRICACSAHE